MTARTNGPIIRVMIRIANLVAITESLKVKRLMDGKIMILQSNDSTGKHGQKSGKLQSNNTDDIKAKSGMFSSDSSDQRLGPAPAHDGRGPPVGVPLCLCPPCLGRMAGSPVDIVAPGLAGTQRSQWFCL